MLINACTVNLNTMQVFKTGVTHYFSIERAKRDFGYEPEARTLDGVVQWFRERGHGRLMPTLSAQTDKEATQKREGQVSSKLWTFVINVILVVVIFALIMSFLPVVN